MNAIGRTNNGNYLVEMTPEEHQALIVLENTAADGSILTMPHSRFRGDDMAPVFGAILAWIEARCQVGALRGLADDLERVLGKEVGE